MANKKVSIYNMNKEFICDAMLLNKKEEIVTIVIQKEMVSAIYTDMILTLYDDVYGLITYEVKLIGFEKEIVHSDTEYTVKFQLGNELEVLQRRSNVKVKTMIPVKFRLIDEDGNFIIDKTTKKIAEYEGVIKDLSAGGVLLVTKEELNTGQFFSFLFEECSKPFEITAEILRYQMQEQEEEEAMGYGCHFLDLALPKESMVRQYVFRVQVLKKKKESMGWVESEEEELEDAK